MIRAQVPVDVATYLLNEKRTEIHTVEARFRVNVVLIPNPHIETPNYEIVRLKHDEVSQSDLAEPSYKLVVAPAEPADALIPAQEIKAVRPLAAVRDIALGLPAPMRPAPPAAQVDRPSLLQTIAAWFTRAQPEAVMSTIVFQAEIDMLQRKFGGVTHVVLPRDRCIADRNPVLPQQPVG